MCVCVLERAHVLVHRCILFPLVQCTYIGPTVHIITSSSSFRLIIIDLLIGQIVQSALSFGTRRRSFLSVGSFCLIEVPADM